MHCHASNILRLPTEYVRRADLQLVDIMATRKIASIEDDGLERE
jgi:hypothetical protein